MIVALQLSYFILLALLIALQIVSYRRYGWKGLLAWTGSHSWWRHTLLHLVDLGLGSFWSWDPVRRTRWKAMGRYWLRR